MRKAHTNCIMFDGYKPCRLHKEQGILCETCREYKPIETRILLLKTAAAGEVIRSTPLLRKIKSLYPQAEITWLTEFPELIPRSYVQRVLKYNWKNALAITEEQFDLLLSLDKDYPVCSLANKIASGSKKGFLLDKNGKIIPADKDAGRKWQTGIFDDLMRANNRHYVEEIFEVCGWQWSGEKYILEDYIIPKLSFNRAIGTPLIGLNTGAGSIWPTRIWTSGGWRTLIEKLMQNGYSVLLLGGPDEHDKNIRLSAETGAFYEGVMNLKEFIGLVSHCDLVVTAVTMALHIAIALEKKIVLLNNIFNKAEFHLYGLGKIIEPDVPCKACYKQNFDAGCVVSDCTKLISPTTIFEQIEALIG